VAALHQGPPGQMTWLEDPPPWLKPWLALAFASVTVWTEGRQLFWGKKCTRVTWLEDFLTSKWPGSLLRWRRPWMYSSALVAFTPLHTSKQFGFNVVIYFWSIRSRLFPVICCDFSLDYHTTTH